MHEYLIREIGMEYETEEEVGPKLHNGALAKSMSKMSKGKLPEDKIKEKLDKHRRSEHFESYVPKVNPEIGAWWISLEEIVL